MIKGKYYIVKMIDNWSLKILEEHNDLECAIINYRDLSEHDITLQLVDVLVFKGHK